MNLSGLLNIDKTAGVTSRRVVDDIKHLVRPAKVGHAGTLDPLATGVLVLGVGPATRLTEYVQRMPKHYSATFLLGRRSDSEDVELPVTLLAHPPRPTRDELDRACIRLTGPIEQRPPAYSAVKINGRRAYQLARRGDPLELPPRKVVVHALRVTRYEYPALDLDIVCGGGTYIRSLGRDLAESLGTAAVMSALTRTAIGDFSIETAHLAGALHRHNIARCLVPPLRAVAGLPQIHLTDAEHTAVAHGRVITRESLAPAGEIAALDGCGRLVAILLEERRGSLRPTKCFSAQ